jgi:hypothetical protein
MVNALQGLVGADELPAAVRAAALEAVRDARGDALKRAVRDFERVAAAAVLDITAPPAEDSPAAVSRQCRGSMASGAAEAGLATAESTMEEAHRRRRAEEVGGAVLEEYLAGQELKVEEEAARAVRAPGLLVRHVPALVTLLAARIEDLRHLFVHLPPALRHEPSLAAREALVEALLVGGLGGDGVGADCGVLSQAQVEVKEALELLADVEDALVQRADEPLRQVTD